jgi:uncharacterized membrane protein YhaH (DUF805 family)
MTREWLNAVLSTRRLGAGNYALCLSLLVVVWFAANRLVVLVAHGLAWHDRFVSRAVFALVGLLFAWGFWWLSTRRLQDMDIDPRFARFLAFPLVAAIALPVLLCLTGQRWDNRYGAPQSKSGVLKVMLCLVSLLVALVLFNDTVAMCQAALQGYR